MWQWSKHSRQTITIIILQKLLSCASVFEGDNIEYQVGYWKDDVWTSHIIHIMNFLMLKKYICMLYKKS